MWKLFHRKHWSCFPGWTEKYVSDTADTGTDTQEKISGVDEVYLEQIHEANDIKKLNERELAGLAEEIRTFLLRRSARQEGILRPIWVW